MCRYRITLLLGCFVFISSLRGANLKQKLYQFENTTVLNGHSSIITRSEAIDQHTLSVVDTIGDAKLTLALCSVPDDDTKAVTIFIDDVRYSNDGESDILFFYFDNILYDIFITAEDSDYGHLWNVFKNSGAIGVDVDLNEGVHNLTVQIMTDQYGVELDSIRLNFYNQKDGNDIICDNAD